MKKVLIITFEMKDPPWIHMTIDDGDHLVNERQFYETAISNFEPRITNQVRLLLEDLINEAKGDTRGKTH